MDIRRHRWNLKLFEDSCKVLRGDAKSKNANQFGFFLQNITTATDIVTLVSSRSFDLNNTNFSCLGAKNKEKKFQL
jgi:hypothetical protein